MQKSLYSLINNGGNGMEYLGTRRRTAPGIEIFIWLRKTKFDLVINIAPGTDVSKKIEGDDFTLKLTYADGSTEVKEHLHFERPKKPYKWKGGKLQESNYMIETSEYKLIVTLNPRLYACNEAKKIEINNEIQRRKNKQKNNQNSKGKKGKKNKGGNPSFRGSSSSGFPRRTTTYYTNTNLHNPYQGGRCSPK